MITFQLYKRFRLIWGRFFFRLMFSRSFKFFGRKVSLTSPDIIEGAQYISLHNNVTVGRKSWLLALKLRGHNPEIVINPGTYIGRFAHVVAVDTITVGSNVLIADKVYISDNIHDFQNVRLPIMQQPIVFKGKVSIGENSWIGENVSVIGASVGRHCVIGANSVVTSDIPDFCVAVGSPAKVIKVFDFESNSWRSV